MAKSRAARQLATALPVPRAPSKMLARVVAAAVQLEAEEGALLSPLVIDVNVDDATSTLRFSTAIPTSRVLTARSMPQSSQRH
jgi:hypothetical protein